MPRGSEAEETRNPKLKEAITKCPPVSKMLTFEAAKMSTTKPTTEVRSAGLAATQVAQSTYDKLELGDEPSTAIAPLTSVEFRATVHDVRRQTLLKKHRDVEDTVSIQHGLEDKI